MPIEETQLTAWSTEPWDRIPILTTNFHKLLQEQMYFGDPPNPEEVVMTFSTSKKLFRNNIVYS